MLKSKSEIEGFKSRLKQYRQAKSEDSQLNYWKYKESIPKYADGTEGMEDKYNFISKPPKDINTNSKAFNEQYY